eukprot:1224481-Rhodomonas_salina.3
MAPPGLQLNGHCSLGSKKDVTTCDPCPPGFWCREGRPYACKSQCPPGQRAFEGPRRLMGNAKKGARRTLIASPARLATSAPGARPRPARAHVRMGKSWLGFAQRGPTTTQGERRLRSALSGS